MTMKNIKKNISAENVTQLFDINVQKDSNNNITSINLTRKNFYNESDAQSVDLTDYFYTRQEVDDRIKIQLVVYEGGYSTLPQKNNISNGKSNYIYLVPFSDTEGVQEGVYKEYVWVEIKDSSKYRTNESHHNDFVENGKHYNYEAVGSTEIDLEPIRARLSTVETNKEDKSNKTSTWKSTTNHTRYPTEKLVKTSLDAKEDVANKTSIWNSTTNHTRYPTEKLVKDSLETLETNLINQLSITVDDEWDSTSSNPVQASVISDNFYDKESLIALLNNIENSNGKLLTVYIDENTGDLVVDDDSYTYYTTEQTDSLLNNKENISNKTAVWGSTTNNTRYPTEKLVKDSLDNKIDKSNTSGLIKNDGTIDTNTYLTLNDISGKEDTANKTTSWGATPNSVRYPTEKLVKDSLDEKSDINHTHNSLNTQNIVSNSDLNDDMYKSQGIYLCESSSKAQSLSNCPVTNAFGMIVIQTYDTSSKLGFKQILMAYNVADSLNVIYTRNFFDTTWTDWRQIRDSYNSYSKNEVDSVLNNKVDKVTGKGLSTNDFTTAEKTKLGNISDEANKTIVDLSLSPSSTNPVQNKIIYSALNDKVDKVTGKGLSTNDFSDNHKNKLDNIHFITLRGDDFVEWWDDLIGDSTITSAYYQNPTEFTLLEISEQNLDNIHNFNDLLKAYTEYNNFNEIYRYAFINFIVPDTWDSFFENRLYIYYGHNEDYDNVPFLSTNFITSYYGTSRNILTQATNTQSTTSSFQVQSSNMNNIEYVQGTTIEILNFKGNNEANATLNINGLGNKPIYCHNRPILANEFKYMELGLFTYVTWTSLNNGNGCWILLNPSSDTIANKVTSISSSSTDDNYPSAKAVYDYVQAEIGDAIDFINL